MGNWVEMDTLFTSSTRQILRLESQSLLIYGRGLSTILEWLKSVGNRLTSRGADKQAEEGILNGVAASADLRNNSFPAPATGRAKHYANRLWFNVSLAGFAAKIALTYYGSMCRSLRCRRSLPILTVWIKLGIDCLVLLLYS